MKDSSPNWDTSVSASSREGGANGLGLVELGGGDTVIALLRSRWTLLLARLLVGGVFIYAGVTKVANPLSFADSIATFQILPPATISIFSLSVFQFSKSSLA